MNPTPTALNILADLDKVVTPRTLPYFDGAPWEVSVGASAIAVTKGQPTPAADERVTDRADYYLWCGANICIHQPPDDYKGKVTSYLASIRPNVQGAFRHPPVNVKVDRWLELVRWAPTASQGASSYTSGMDENINGSIGFFGDAPTASVGGGITWSNSETRTTPDVDIAAYTRSDSATFMFNLNQPSTISATSSMELYVQALFRLEGFSPEYLAYIDYSPAQDIQKWTASKPGDRATLLSQRGFLYTNAITFGFQIDFQAVTTTNILPMAPVTVSCGTPVVNPGGDDWSNFLSKPTTPLPVSSAVGNIDTFIGYLICNDQNYQSGLADENPNVMLDYQTLQSRNGLYNLNINQNGALQISTSYGMPLWTEQVNPSWLQPVHIPVSNKSVLPSTSKPLPVTAALQSKQAVNPNDPHATNSPTVSAPVQVSPLKLVLTGPNYTVTTADGGLTREFDFASQPPPASNATKADAYAYRRLELTGDGTLRLMDSSGSILWATKYVPPSTTATTSSSGIFSSLGGAVNGIEAIGGGVLQLAESSLGIGSLIPGGGSLGDIPGLGSVIGSLGAGFSTGEQIGQNIVDGVKSIFGK